MSRKEAEDLVGEANEKMFPLDTNRLLAELILVMVEVRDVLLQIQS